MSNQNTKPAIEVNVGGLKCDAPGCDFIDMSIKVEDYEQWVNAPCPKCGGNLLTEADFRNVKFLLKMAEMANKILPPRTQDPEATMSVKMNGTGEMEFDIKEYTKH
ncbi:hypothetical protein ACFYKX_11300 [Cytobacillus sp. FJAT-54145]|uniref:Uncharacterized protein n=1 Tax=Cytobacillus spartinae TaxID=3299023 RepID=A0ABW6KAB9_9BACI